MSCREFPTIWQCWPRITLHILIMGVFPESDLNCLGKGLHASPMNHVGVHIFCVLAHCGKLTRKVKRGHSRRLLSLAFAMIFLPYFSFVNLSIARKIVKTDQHGASPKHNTASLELWTPHFQAMGCAASTVSKSAVSEINPGGFRFRFRGRSWFRKVSGFEPPPSLSQTQERQRSTQSFRLACLTRVGRQRAWAIGVKVGKMCCLARCHREPLFQYGCDSKRIPTCQLGKWSQGLKPA